MAGSVSLLELGDILLRPGRVFARLAPEEPDPTRVFFGLTLWLTLLPPLFIFIGTHRFGWLLGVEPIVLPDPIIAVVSIGYFVLLAFGFVTTALISAWMANTYGAQADFGRHFALVSVVGAPLAVGSIVHLYPHAFINVLVLVPILIWVIYLLYRGLPVMLGTGPERGMLMASALVAYLLVAWVSLIGITAALWRFGLGPVMGI
jgi:Yip1 domain